MKTSQKSYRLFGSVVAVVLFLLILAAIFPQGVTAAIQGIARYIPGLGLVEKDASVWAIAAPVEKTQVNVTLTVENAVLTPNKASILLSVRGLTPEMMGDGSATNREKECYQSPSIRLPDGSLLSSSGSMVASYDLKTGYSKYYFFTPENASGTFAKNLREVILMLDCVPGTRLDAVSKQWEIPLKFTLPSPDLANFPVEEISPASEGAKPGDSSPLSLDQVIKADDGYVFIGTFRPLFPDSQIWGSEIESLAKITDARGQELNYFSPADLVASGSSSPSMHWAYKILEKEVAWPVTIRFDTIDASCYGNGVFSFDVGENPQVGQVWEQNQKVQVGSCSFQVLSVSQKTDGYVFRMAGPAGSGVRLQNPKISGLTEKSLDTRDYSDVTEQTLYFNETPPKGTITVTFEGVQTKIAGPWQVNWQPAK